MDRANVRNGNSDALVGSEFSLNWHLDADLSEWQYAPGTTVNTAGATIEKSDADGDTSLISDASDDESYPIPMNERNGALKAYLVRGAWLTCVFGSHHRYLNLPRSHGSYVDDGKEYPIMNAMDCTPGQVDTSNLTEGQLGGSLSNFGNRVLNRITGKSAPETQILQVTNLNELNIPPFGVCQSPTGPQGLPNILLKSEKIDPSTGKAKENSDGTAMSIEDNIKGPPCLIDIVGCWQNTSQDTLVGLSGETPYEALLCDSFLQCRYGGFIVPKTSGQPDIEPATVEQETIEQEVTDQEVDSQEATAQEPKDRVESNAIQSVVDGPVWPVTGGVISSQYYLYEPTRPDHKGVDISADAGTPIMATIGGVVHYVDEPYKTNEPDPGSRSFGNQVRIIDENNTMHIYVHMSKVWRDDDGNMLSVNTTVNAGDIIGYVGNTGDSRGNHLHYQVEINGAHVDPNDYLP